MAGNYGPSPVQSGFLYPRPGTDPYHRSNIASPTDPPGYTWDSVKGEWTPVVGSPARQLTAADTAAAQEAKLFNLATSSGAFSGGTSGGTSGLTSGGSVAGGTGTARIPTPAMAGLQSAGQPGGAGQTAPIDTRAAQSAAFGQAKDQIGQESAGALTGLRSALGGRGMLGSGAEYRGTTGIINRGQQELGTASRQQATEAAGLAERTATTNAANALTSRGQDLSAQQTGYEGQIAQRGQDISAQSAANASAAQIAMAQAQARQSMLNGLLSALGTGKGAY